MGRRSKRLQVPAGSSVGNSLCPKTVRYKAGIYARLSSDQDLRKNESIDVQIEIAKKFAEEWNGSHTDRIEVIHCYTDLGRTGTNFDRDGFKRLMQDVRMGDINCVIVKDLSRFGRNYLEAGNYIEKIFPFLGVRFIAVADGFDTGAEGNDTRQMASEIKNLVNDMYAKEFSYKAKLSLVQRREEGSYVGGPPPYGYKAIWEGRLRQLVLDESAAEMVRFIYRKFIETESYTAVSDDLNRKRVNPPAVYKRTGELYCPSGVEYKGWDKSSVERIVKSRTYQGTLAQGKSSLTARKEDERVYKPESEWVVKEHAHESLVDDGTTGEAARVLKKMEERAERKGHLAFDCPLGEDIFDGVLFCGVCGRKLTRRSHVRGYADGSRKRVDEYFCLDAGSTKTDKCPESNHILKADLEEILCELLKLETVLKGRKQKEYTEAGREHIERKKQEIRQKQDTVQRECRELDRESGESYMRYRMGDMSREEFGAGRQVEKERREGLKAEEERLKGEILRIERDGEKYLKAVRSLVKLKGNGIFTKDLVEALVEKIYLYPGKRVEVLFAYEDILRKGADAG